MALVATQKNVDTRFFYTVESGGNRFTVQESIEFLADGITRGRGLVLNDKTRNEFFPFFQKIISRAYLDLANLLSGAEDPAVVRQQAEDIVDSCVQQVYCHPKVRATTDSGTFDSVSGMFDIIAQRVGRATYCLFDCYRRRGPLFDDQKVLLDALVANVGKLH